MTFRRWFSGAAATALVLGVYGLLEPGKPGSAGAVAADSVAPGDERVVVRFRQSRAGYLSVNGKVNGRPVNLIIDTGAPNSYLDRERATSLGVVWKLREGNSPSRVQRNPPFGAIAGPVDGVTQLGQKRAFRIELHAFADSIDIGQLRTGSIEVGAHDLSSINLAVGRYYNELPFDGIIGADVLGPGMAIIDYGSRTLSLVSAGQNTSKKGEGQAARSAGQSALGE
jgi:hypothetical protein